MNTASCAAAVQRAPAAMLLAAVIAAVAAPAGAINEYPDPTPPSRVGLWQVKAEGTTGVLLDPLNYEIGSANGQRNRVLRPDANFRYMWTSELDGSVGEWYATDFTWGNDSNSCFDYSGYVFLLGGTTYVFLVDAVSHWRYVAIDGVTLLEVWNESGVADTFSYACTQTGWHSVYIGAGRWTQPDHDILCGNGFAYSTDGGETYAVFEDPGDGSFLRTVKDIIGIGETKNFADKAYIGAQFDSSIAGCTLEVCFSASYSGTDYASWEDKMPIADAIGPGENLRTLVAEIPDGAEYVRITASNGSERYWSEAVTIAGFSPVEDVFELLTMSLGSIEAAGNGNVAVSVRFDGFGEGEACDLVLVATNLATEAVCEVPVVNGLSQAGDYVYTVGGFEPGDRYDFSLYAIFQGQRKKIDDNRILLALPVPDDVGLWQAKVEANNLVGSLDPMNYAVGASVASSRNHVLRPEAYFNYSWTSQLDGSYGDWKTTYTVWGDDTHSTYAYCGYMYMESNTSYRFAARINEGISQVFYMSIDGVMYRDSDFYDYVCESTGWYNVYFWAYTWNHPSATALENALTVSTDGGETANVLEDPGDGSVFRVEPFAPMFVSLRRSGAGRITAEADFEDGLAGATIYMCLANAYSDNIADWTTVDCGTVASGGGARVLQVLPSASYAYVRIAADNSGTVHWSRAKAIREIPLANDGLTVIVK